MRVLRAGLLSLVVPGVGQVYASDRRAAALYAGDSVALASGFVVLPGQSDRATHAQRRRPRAARPRGGTGGRHLPERRSGPDRHGHPLAPGYRCVTGFTDFRADPTRMPGKGPRRPFPGLWYCDNCLCVIGAEPPHRSDGRRIRYGSKAKRGRVPGPSARVGDDRRGEVGHQPRNAATAVAAAPSP